MTQALGLPRSRGLDQHCSPMALYVVLVCHSLSGQLFIRNPALGVPLYSSLDADELPHLGEGQGLLPQRSALQVLQESRAILEAVV